MINITKSYTNLLDYANKLCLGDKNNSVDGVDLVNEAYIELHNDESATPQIWMKKIKSIFLDLTRNRYSDECIIRETQRVCTMCHIEKPAAAFMSRSTWMYIIKNQLDFYCRDCRRKYNNLYAKKTEQREKNKKRVAKYVSKDRAAYNAYQRERYKEHGRKDRKAGLMNKTE